MDENEICAPFQWIKTPCEYCLKSPPSRIKRLEWNWLPVAYCITLASRPERKRQADQEFHRVGLCGKIIYYSTQKDNISGIRGCWESHRSIAKKCIEDNAEWYLVFEDDIVFKRNFDQKNIDKIESSLLDITTTTPSWKMLYLGGLPKSLWYSPTKDYASWHAWMCHAVIVSKDMARIVGQNSYNSFHHPFQENRVEIDGFWLRFDNSFVVFPPMAFTADHGISDLNSERPTLFKRLQELKNKVEAGGLFFIEEVYIWLLALLPYSLALVLLAVIVVLVIVFGYWLVKRFQC